MANNFLILGVLGAAGWVFINGPPPMRPVEPSPLSRTADADTSAIASASTGRSAGIEPRRDPVPFVRKVRSSPAFAGPSATSAPNETPAPAAEPAPAVEQDELDRKVAKAAAELDGYRRVSIVGKASNGAWRAKGFRGTEEILLTVDGTGRVSME